MADEHIPPSSPHSSPRFPNPLGITQPSDNGNGTLPKPELSAPPGSKSGHAVGSEMTRFGRWLLGCLIVVVGGWGALGLALYLLLHYHVNRPELIFGVLAVLDLALFFWLESGFWLSRFMGLRIEPGFHSWHSAILLFLFGLFGLLFRPTNFQPQAEAQAATRSRTRPQAPPRGDSAREIVETIVFVVVLVLLLKSFAAEAFVIPTGSMAETLLGYQKEVTCPDCGLKFPINCSQEVDPSEGQPIKVYACVCPNCRQQIHFPKPPQSYLDSHRESREVSDPGWNSGDRVLVAKFVYDLLNKNPDRLDVVVFKYPGDNNFPHTGPHRNHVPMNYIKRCIGEPGETIAICGGNVYSLSAEEGPDYDDYTKYADYPKDQRDQHDPKMIAPLEQRVRDQHDPKMMPILWQKQYMHIDNLDARERFQKGRFHIIRKNPDNILSMMRLVFDNDHPSKTDPASTNRWTSADGGWTAIETRGFRPNGDSNRTSWLHYRHIQRDNAGKPALITDLMGYNTYQSLSHQSPSLDNNWVGDLILECEAAIDNPQGELTLELARGVDRFQARWDLTTGICTLFRVNQDGEQQLESKPTALNKKGTYRLRFADVDERLVVWVDGDLPFDNGFTYQAPSELGPRPESDLERPASIGVRGAGVAIHKLKLFRDTYYTVGGVKEHTSPHERDVPGFDAVDPSTWHDLKDPPFVTLYVQPDHFLCLGDNSPESSDGRSWGAVPRRLLLGRALLVYYPFGRAGRIR